MLSATQYLHAQHILHLDLRSENMMITEYNLLKVVDLGSAQSLHQEKVLPSESFKDYLETMGACVSRVTQLQGPGLGCSGKPLSTCPACPTLPSSSKEPSSHLCIPPDSQPGPTHLGPHVGPLTCAHTTTWVRLYQCSPSQPTHPCPCASVNPPGLSSVPPPCAPFQLRSSWRARGLSHRQTSGPSV